MAINEALELNGIELNSLAGTFSLEALDLTPPAKKPEWAQNSDADGSDLIRTPLFENRTVTANIRVNPQVSMNVALEKIGELVDQLQEAEKNPNGIALKWTPANSTKTITFFVLTGAVTGLPIMVEGTPGWFQAAPLLVVSMICKPFGYGAEVVGAEAKSIETGLSVVVLTVPTVAGDVSAEGRLVVKDIAKVPRRFVEWGIQNRYYDATTALILDNEAMTPVAGVQSAALNASGAYRGSAGTATNGTILTTLVNEPTVCANTGVLKHVGTYRVKARIQAVLGGSSEPSKVQVRLAWKDGEGPFRGNGWEAPPLGGKFVEVDLGIITVTPAISGTQKWLGQVEAFSENAAASDSLHIDYLTFVPVLEGYGKALAPQSLGGGTVGAFDNFSTGTLSGALSGRTIPLGAAWSTAGAATDWTVFFAQQTGGGAERKVGSQAEPRIGVVGSALENSRVSGTFKLGTPTTGKITGGLVLRWVNATNYAALVVVAPGGNRPYNVELRTVVAGVTTVVSRGALSAPTTETTVTASLTATTDGAITGKITSPATVTLSGTNAALATAGALVTGKGGVIDEHTGTGGPTRTVTNIAVTSLPAIPFCVQSERTLEVRSDSTVAQDSSGTYYGPVPVYRGSRFYVPQKGSAGRTSRIIVKADRNDLEEADQQTIADAFTAQCFVTPRYLVCPR